VVGRAELVDRVWGREQEPSPRAIDNAVVRLRQALHDDDGQLIRSVRGVGYQWAPE
jgi:DNA-binding response OmpR family regulator